MKSLLWKLAPGAIVTIVALAVGGTFAAKSQAQDKVTAVARTSSPAPAVYAEPAPPQVRYLEQPHGRADDRCNQCGAELDRYGRAILVGDRRRHDRDDYEYRGRDRDRDDQPQVVYVVHVDGGNAYDLRAWPQSIFPMSTRWAMPIRTACRN